MKGVLILIVVDNRLALHIGYALVLNNMSLNPYCCGQ